jgi:RNA polymerase sigma-70 factor (ECF subfamily)
VEFAAFASAFDTVEGDMSQIPDLATSARAPAAGARPDRDRLLIAAIADGDRRAFDEIYREYGPRVFRFSYRLIRDQTRAEEVTNDVMFEVWKHAARFENRSSVSTWIFGITRHRTLNAVRGKTLYLTDIDQADDIADETTTAEMALDQATVSNALRAALNKLSPDHREVLELAFFYELSYKEIAEIANCPENTVKTRMFHAKKRLEPFLAAMVAAGAVS